METTRLSTGFGFVVICILPFHEPITAATSPAALQSHPPTRQARPGAKRVIACGGADFPAGHCHRGSPGVSPATQQKRQGGTGFCRQLQPPSRYDGKSMNFPQHRSQGSAAQGFLHSPKQFPVLGRINDNQVGRTKAEAFQPRRMQLFAPGFARAAPQNRCTTRSAAQKRRGKTERRHHCIR